MTLDLTNSQTGLGSGQGTNATIYADLVVYEQYDNPLYPFVEDAGSTLQLTNVTLAATPGSSNPSGEHLFMSFAVGAVVVIALAGIVLVTRKKERPENSV
jgi:hypothetical protein